MKLDERLVRREYFKNLFPMIFSTLGGTLNTFVDSIFVSNIVGEDGLAAVNMCLPIYLIMCTFGALIGWGAGALSARELGHDNVEGAERRYNDALKLSLYAGGGISIIGCVLIKPISLFLAQGSGIYELIFTYAFYSFLSAIPNCILYVATQYLQLEGKLKSISWFMTIMIASDTLLDYILMVPLNMGMRGAALASLISVMIAGAYGLYKLQTGVSNYHFKSSKLTKNDIKEIAVAGSPFALGNCCDVFKTVVLNSLILHFAGTGAVAVLAIINSMAEICISITTGVPNAAGPLVGVFYSARENHSIKSLMKLQLRTGLILSITAGAILVWANEVIARAFASEVSLLIPLACYATFLVLDMCASIYSGYINKCGHALLANAIVFCRRLFAPLAAVSVVLLLHLYLWLFYVLMGVLSAILIIVLERMFRRKSFRGEYRLEGLLLLDYHLDRENKVIDFSVDANAEKICEASEQIIDFCRANNMPAKTGMKLQMAIEELLTVYVAKLKDLHSIDLRSYSLPGNIGIRVRVSGERYNPFEKNDSEDDDFLMGIRIIEKMAEVINYTYVLGLNNINIIFDSDNNEGQRGKG